MNTTRIICHDYRAGYWPKKCSNFKMGMGPMAQIKDTNGLMKLKGPFCWVVVMIMRVCSYQQIPTAQLSQRRDHCLNSNPTEYSKNIYNPIKWNLRILSNSPPNLDILHHGKVQIFYLLTKNWLLLPIIRVILLIIWIMKNMVLISDTCS